MALNNSSTPLLTDSLPANGDGHEKDDYDLTIFLAIFTFVYAVLLFSIYKWYDIRVNRKIAERKELYGSLLEDMKLPVKRRWMIMDGEIKISKGGYTEIQYPAGLQKNNIEVYVLRGELVFRKVINIEAGRDYEMKEVRRELMECLNFVHAETVQAVKGLAQLTIGKS